MNQPNFRNLLLVAAVALSFTACSPKFVSGHLQGLQSLLADLSATDAPSASAETGSAEAAIQGVILRGNHEQEQSIASRDSSAMRDTSTDSYYRDLARINQDMLDHGITQISLTKIEWGDVTVAGSTATAATWETWVTQYSDGGTDQSRDKNVYTLVQSDGVWKIQTDEHPADLRPVPSASEPTLPQADVPSAPLSPRGRGQSANWSGYAATGGTFTSVAGTWTVPQIAADAPIGSDAAWVGIGGERSRDLIQAGTQESVIGPGRVRYNAWIEMLPDYARPVPLAVHPGDSVTVSIDQLAAGSWLIAMKNNTTGGSYDRTVQYESSLSSAEWVEEAPTGGRGTLLPLSNFGAVTFTNTSAVKDGRLVSPAEAGASPITMTNGRGEPLAVPSVLVDGGTAFQVTRTGNEPVVFSPGSRPRRRD
ncbi:MAG: hypothetical protein EXR58_04375 [Chloroflexi bacterium]|nr:hypothetical protein [Chloroflexota bacterium]